MYVYDTTAWHFKGKDKFSILTFYKFYPSGCSRSYLFVSKNGDTVFIRLYDGISFF